MPSPGPRRLTPLSGIGIRYITIGGRRIGSAPRPPAKGRPSIQWASCVFKQPKPEEPEPPKMVKYTGPLSGGFTILVPEFVAFSDPCA